MKDITFGDLDARELTLRFFSPWSMRVWDCGHWRLAWTKLLSPFAWWAAITSGEWAAWCRRYPNNTHRCYCPTGSSFDGRIILAGFGLVWFYSRFTGDLPCPCDVVMDELFPEHERIGDER